MPSWPPQWIRLTLEALGAEVSSASIAVMRAWSASTPIPPLTNNPIGMPASTTGAPRYLGTPYAIFPTMDAYYKAVSAFARTSSGRDIASALSQDLPAASVWRAVSILGWPGSASESDYPSGVLDISGEAYKASVLAKDVPDRKTSGMVGGSTPNRATVLDHARSVHQIVSTAGVSRAAVRMLLERNK